MQRSISTILFIGSILLCAHSCTSPTPDERIGYVERIDAELDAIVNKDAVVEVIADGFEWSEGPLWIEKDQMLLFSDIPNNTIFKWTEARGKEVYLKPSGYTGTASRGGETGSNGLALDLKENLILAQHGDRRIARMNAALNTPKPDYISIASHYEGKRFNSPNDLVIDSSGDIFFTDPPYGLEKAMDDPSKELPIQGVYKVKTNGTVILLTDTLTRPNGIALTPDRKTLIIANSDQNKKTWYAFDLASPDSMSNGRVIFDATGDQAKGSPDGLKIDSKGNIFATGPGGVWIFNSSYKLIGKIRVREATSNCAFDADEKVLFITADDYVLRVRLRD